MEPGVLTGVSQRIFVTKTARLDESLLPPMIATL